MYREEEHQGNEAHHDQRQRCAYMGEDDQHPDEFQSRDREIFRSMMKELGQREEIVGDP